jgi:hypothetical protein
MERSRFARHTRWLAALTVLSVSAFAACGNDRDSGKAGTGAGPSSGGSGGSGGSGAGGTRGSPDADAADATSGNGGSGGLDAGADADAGSAGTDGGLGDAGSTSDGGTTGPCMPVNDTFVGFTPGPKLSKAEVSRSIAAISAVLKASSLPSDPQAFATAARSAVQGVAGVAETGIAGDCTVLVTLTDGTPISVFDDTRTGPPRGPGADAAAPSQFSEPSGPAPESGRRVAPLLVPEHQTLRTLAAEPAGFLLPGAGEARLGYIESFGTLAFPAITLALLKRGYHVSPGPNPAAPPSLGMSSAELRNGVKKLGVLWLSTHGLTCHTGTKKEPHYCIATDTLDPNDATKCVLSDSAQCDFNDADVDLNNRAAFFVNGNGTEAWYAINDNWVRDYWTFADHALVFLDACNSMTNSPQAVAFRKAIAAKGGTTILGWTGVVGATFSQDAAIFLFDRLLGGNKDRVTPPQRPFSLPEVLTAMKAKGKTADPRRPGTELKQEQHEALDINLGGVPDLILAPSIRNLTIGDPSNMKTPAERRTNTELTLAGEFGAKAGSVEVGCVDPPNCTTGAVVAVKSWDENGKKVVVYLPSTGTASGGFVRVKVAAGSQTITSNAVPLTSWRGTCRAKVNYFPNVYGAPGPVMDLNCAALHYRADLHPFRLAPEESAIPGSVNAAGARDPVVIGTSNSGGRGPVSDSVCNGSFAGTTLGAQGITYVWSNGTKSPIPWVENAEGNGIPSDPVDFWYYTLPARIDTGARTFTLQAVFRAVGTLTMIFPSPPGSQVVQNNVPEAAHLEPPPIPLGSNFSVVQPTKALTNENGNWQFECNLPVESGTAPDNATEG